MNEPIYTVLHDWHRMIGDDYYTVSEREPAPSHKCSRYMIRVTVTVKTAAGPIVRTDVFALWGETVDEAFEGLPENVQQFGTVVRDRIIAIARRPVAARFNGA